MQYLYQFCPICNYILWQHSSGYCRKICLANLHPKAPISAKIHGNWAETEEEICDLRFSIILEHVTCYHGNILFVTVEKCVMLTYIRRQRFIMNSMRIGRTLRNICHESFCPTLAHNMPIPWQYPFCHCRNLSCK